MSTAEDRVCGCEHLQGTGLEHVLSEEHCSKPVFLADDSAIYGGTAEAPVGVLLSHSSGMNPPTSCIRCGGPHSWTTCKEAMKCSQD